jgi:hypothetical protein
MLICDAAYYKTLRGQIDQHVSCGATTYEMLSKEERAVLATFFIAEQNKNSRYEFIPETDRHDELISKLIALMKTWGKSWQGRKQAFDEFDQCLQEVVIDYYGKSVKELWLEHEARNL